MWLPQEANLGAIGKTITTKPEFAEVVARKETDAVSQHGGREVHRRPRRNRKRRVNPPGSDRADRKVLESPLDCEVTEDNIFRPLQTESEWDISSQPKRQRVVLRRIHIV